MSVLAIDTSSRDLALVLHATPEGRALGVREVPAGHLDEQLPAALAAFATERFSAIVVVIGPGSYTGVRAGMAIALGLATVRRVPLHGIGSLAALAAAAAAGDPGRRRILAIADAGRGGLYTAGYLVADGTITPLPGHDLRRTTAAALDAAGTLDGECLVAVASSPLAGPSVPVVAARQVLATAVPYALRVTPLSHVGLTAIQA